MRGPAASKMTAHLTATPGGSEPSPGVPGVRRFCHNEIKSPASHIPGRIWLHLTAACPLPARRRALAGVAQVRLCCLTIARLRLLYLPACTSMPVRRKERRCRESGRRFVSRLSRRSTVKVSSHEFYFPFLWLLIEFSAFPLATFEMKHNFVFRHLLLFIAILYL